MLLTIVYSVNNNSGSEHYAMTTLLKLEAIRGYVHGYGHPVPLRWDS